MRIALARISIVAALAPAVLAQPVGTMRITADDQAAVTVSPGTPVHIESVISWTLGPQTGGSALFAGITGDLIVDNNAGVASNFSSHFNPGAHTNYGAFVGGSRVGIDIIMLPPFFTGPLPPPQMASDGILVAGYDLTLTQPGTYQVNWIPDPAYPELRLWVPPLLSLSGVPTTYLGATIIVTPAPASLAMLAAAAASTPRRRRAPA